MVCWYGSYLFPVTSYGWRSAIRVGALLEVMWYSKCCIYYIILHLKAFLYRDNLVSKNLKSINTESIRPLILEQRSKMDFRKGRLKLLVVLLVRLSTFFKSRPLKILKIVVALSDQILSYHVTFLTKQLILWIS